MSLKPRVLDLGLAEGLCLVLVDFDNISPPGHRALSAELLAHELLAVIREIRRMTSAPSQFLIRLYGGWYSDGLLTAAGSRTAQLIAEASLFPLIDNRGIILRGEIELVDELIAVPGVAMGSTYRLRGGLPRLRLSSPGTPAGCASSPTQCPIAAFHKLARTKAAICPAVGCAVSATDAFIVHEQKMVDTLLACDLLEAARQMVQRIVLVTSDSDLLPPLLQACANGAERFMLISDEGQWTEQHAALLQSAGVATAYRSKLL